MKFEKINKNQLGDSTYYVDDRRNLLISLMILKLLVFRGDNLQQLVQIIF